MTRPPGPGANEPFSDTHGASAAQHGKESRASLDGSGSRGLGKLSRRELMAYSAAFGSTFMAAQGLGAETPAQPQPARKPPTKRYDMKKSINLWALPYPDKMSLRECFELCKAAGFDAVEVNYALEGDLSPEASEARAIWVQVFISRRQPPTFRAAGSASSARLRASSAFPCSRRSRASRSPNHTSS